MYSDDDFRYFALKIIELKPDLDEVHSRKFSGIRLFTIQLDERYIKILMG